MNRRLLIVYALAFIVLFPGMRLELVGQSSNNFLHYAEEAGHWLEYEAIPFGNTYAWPDSASGSNFYTNLYSGVPGILTLYAQLYESTGDSMYSHYAINGAQWLIDIAVPEAGGYKWSIKYGDADYRTGLYMGAPGIGDAFLNLFEIFGDTLYLNYAKGAADWILSLAEFDSIDQCKWSSGQAYSSYATDIIFGSAGIGLFLLRMYEATNDPEYLNYAKYAGNQLVSIAIPDSNGCKWAIANTNPDIYTGFSHGCAGIAYFLTELFTCSNDSTYLEYAKSAAQWLINIAIPEAGGCKWWAKEGSTSTYFSTGWCHGPAGTCLPFIKLYQITYDSLYLTYARLGAAWLINNGGYKYDITICHGATGVGDFFLEMFFVTNDSLYYNYAEDAAYWLETKADSSIAGYRWATYGGYDTGFSTGTAGVGIFFLKLHHIEQTPLTIESISISDELSLQNFPNPFSQTTTIQINGLDLPINEKAELNIFNTAGILVRSIPVSRSQISTIEVKWDGNNDFGKKINSGIYYARLEAGNRCLQTTKLLLL